jgi:hypothetical protein
MAVPVRLRLARHMAVSASRNNVAVCVRGRPPALTPPLASTWNTCPATAMGLASSVCMRCATARACSGVVRGRIAATLMAG